MISSNLFYKNTDLNIWIKKTRDGDSKLNTKKMINQPHISNNSEKKIWSIFGSYRFLILIVVTAYFFYAQYMLYKSIIFSADLILNFTIYQELMQVPWWIVVFYSSELGGTIGGILRSIGSVFALYCALVFFIKKQESYPRIRKKVGIALILEAGFFLFLIPTVVLGFVYPITYGNLWYFDITPVPEVFFVAGIACLALVTIIPVILLKLSSEIFADSSKTIILRWSLLGGVSYLFVVFWFDALMQWIGMIFAFGTNILADPLNLAGFVTSTVGLLLIAIYGLFVIYPILRKKSNYINGKKIGAIMTAFGSYFISGIIIYFLAGGFVQRPFAWYEIIVPHNPYLWCVVFFFTGLLQIVKPRKL